MTITNGRYILWAFAAATGIFISPALAQTPAALTPIPSTGTAAQGVSAADAESIVVDQNGYCPECVDPTESSGNIFTDNIITRSVCCISRDFQRNNCWPRPFVWKDREATRASFVTMVNKGWQRENTLGEFHFLPDTGELNESGRLRVHWIVTQQLPQRRAIFVHRAIREQETEARVDSVQQWVAQIIPRGNMPPVLETNVPAPSRPAEEVDHIRVEWLKTMPAPQLPAVESMDTGYSS